MKTPEEIEKRIREWGVDGVVLERNKLVEPDFKKGILYMTEVVKAELRWVLDQ